MSGEPDETPAGRFDRYLAKTERDRPELADKYDRMARRKRRESLPTSLDVKVLSGAVAIGIIVAVINLAGRTLDWW